MTKRQSWQDEYLTMIDDCEKRESRLSDWERTFVESIANQLATGKTLSKAQTEKLDDIWEKATKRG